jgi:predicted glycosyltransferase
VSVYAGKWAAIDEELIREGRLKRIQSREEISGLSVEKKCGLNPRDATSVREQIVELILEPY